MGMIEVAAPTAAAGVTLSIALASLLRRAPPRLAALFAPGLVLALMAAGRLLHLEPGRGTPYYADETAKTLLLWLALLGVGFAGAPGLIAPAMALRPPAGERARPTPGRAVVAFVAALAASVPFWFVGQPEAGWVMTFPAGVVLLALRSSPSLDRARADAAVVQLVGGACMVAGLLGATALTAARWPSTTHLPWAAALTLPPLALAAAAFVHTGRPSRRTLACAAAPLLFAAVLVFLGGWNLGAAERRLRDLEPDLVAAPGSVQRLPIDACFSALGGPPCGRGTTVWLGAPNEVVPADLVTLEGAALAATGPDGAPGIVTLAHIDPLHRPTSHTLLPIAREGGQVRVGNAATGELAAVTSAQASCGRLYPAFDPSEAWTLRDVVAGCLDGWCVLARPAPTEPQCGWDAELGWVLRCPTGGTCSVPPGGTVRSVP